jgi:hypothetical protein
MLSEAELVQRALDNISPDVLAGDHVTTWDIVKESMHVFLNALAEHNRAQADARPIYQLQLMNGDWRDQTEQSYQNNQTHFADKTRIVYTAPPAESAGVGLSEDEWIDLAGRHANSDWDANEPDGFLNAVKALVTDALSRTHAADGETGERNRTNPDEPNMPKRGTLAWLVRLLQQLQAHGTASEAKVYINDPTFGRVEVGGALYGIADVELTPNDDDEPEQAAQQQDGEAATQSEAIWKNGYECGLEAGKKAAQQQSEPSLDAIGGLKSQTIITLRQVDALLAFFGGHDAEVALAQYENGLIAWCTECPEEGSFWLGATEVDDELADKGRSEVSQQAEPGMDEPAYYVRRVHEGHPPEFNTVDEFSDGQGGGVPLFRKAKVVHTCDGDSFVLEFERWNAETGALPRGGSWMAEVSDIIQRAAQSGQRAGVAEAVIETLRGIVNANWRTWDELASPEEFERWAKSRANHALHVLGAAAPTQQEAAK